MRVALAKSTKCVQIATFEGFSGIFYRFKNIIISLYLTNLSSKIVYTSYTIGKCIFVFPKK